MGEGAVSKSYFLMPFLVGHTRRARRLSNLIEGAVHCPAKSVNLFLNFGSVTSAANSAQREAPLSGFSPSAHPEQGSKRSRLAFGRT